MREDRGGREEREGNGERERKKGERRRWRRSKFFMRDVVGRGDSIVKLGEYLYCFYLEYSKVKD